MITGSGGGGGRIGMKSPNEEKGICWSRPKILIALLEGCKIFKALLCCRVYLYMYVFAKDFG